MFRVIHLKGGEKHPNVKYNQCIPSLAPEHKYT